jgi:hypothetical protein
VKVQVTQTGKADPVAMHDARLGDRQEEPSQADADAGRRHPVEFAK